MSRKSITTRGLSFLLASQYFFTTVFYLSYDFVVILSLFRIGPISNSGGPVKGLGFIHLQLLEDIKRASSETSVVSFQCYSTGCEVLQPNNSQELMELLEAFPQTLITSSQARGVPLKVCVQYALVGRVWDEVSSSFRGLLFISVCSLN